MVIEMTIATIISLSTLLLLLTPASIYPYVRFQIWCLARSVVWAVGHMAVGLCLLTLLALLGWPLWM